MKAPILGYAFHLPPLALIRKTKKTTRPMIRERVRALFFFPICLQLSLSLPPSLYFISLSPSLTLSYHLPLRDFGKEKEEEEREENEEED